MTNGKRAMTNLPVPDRSTMKQRITHTILSLTCAGSLLVCPQAWAGPNTTPASLTAKGETPQSTYDTMLTSLQAEVSSALPSIDEKKQADLMQAMATLNSLVSPAAGSSAAQMGAYRQARDLAESNADKRARAILADVDAFLNDNTHDATLSKIALLTHATPNGLAAFAQQGPTEEGLIEALLDDAALVQQIMKLGGSYRGRYGEGMATYKAILDASEHARDGFLRRFALASAMEHSDQPSDKVVNVYLDYEKAWFDGVLDAAFDSYSDFNYRFVMHYFGVDHLNWMRTMLRNYRPDHVRNPDYKWRHCGIVKTDVPYRSGLTGKRPLRPDLNLTSFQDFFLKGGICGPRAFTGKLSTSAFGIPTRSAQQTAHAAMCHWTPDGWTVVLGGGWPSNRHRDINGADFSLEERARRAPGDEYIQVHRAHWAADALLGAPATRRDHYEYARRDHIWDVLASFRKRMIVEDANIEELELTGAELAESNVESNATPVAQITITDADRKITTTDDGVITIPPGAAVSPTSSTEKICFMRTIEDDGVQVHYALQGNRPEAIKYYVEAPAAGSYELTMRVCTVTVDRTFMLRLNRRTLLDIPLPYTKGYWADTEPLKIDLIEGRNNLMFTGQEGNKGVSIRHFKLRPL
jgi:hypothetical protein